MHFQGESFYVAVVILFTFSSASDTVTV